MFKQLRLSRLWSEDLKLKEAHESDVSRIQWAGQLKADVTHLREGELVERHADALLTALHGGRALWCIQGHHLVGFNHHTILKKTNKQKNPPNCTRVDLLYMPVLDYKGCPAGVITQLTFRPSVTVPDPDCQPAPLWRKAWFWGRLSWSAPQLHLDPHSANPRPNKSVHYVLIKSRGGINPLPAELFWLEER